MFCIVVIILYAPIIQTLEPEKFFKRVGQYERKNQLPNLSAHQASWQQNKKYVKIIK